jgi:pantoate--beta-alanine ligase
LLEIVKPEILFLGQKDYQQCKVIQRLIDIKKLPVKLKIIETMREDSGLALSSRNLRLSDTEKEQALAIYRSLNFIKDNYTKSAFNQLIEDSTAFLLNNGFIKVDYVSIVNADTLKTVEIYTPGTKLIALIAAYIGEVRLIDNMLLT